ncbi:MAG TPA: hypothetical protein VFS00_34250 [Polyangiaceae bacterium]|nr:hypothetical protein [Polyangiaceae bacterium]
MTNHRFALAALAPFALWLAGCAESAPTERGPDVDEPAAVDQGSGAEPLGHCTFWQCADGSSYPTQAVCRGECPDPDTCSPFNVCLRQELERRGGRAGYRCGNAARPGRRAGGAETARA